MTTSQGLISQAGWHWGVPLDLYDEFLFGDRQCQLRRPPSGLFFWWGDFGQLQWKKMCGDLDVPKLATVNSKITMPLRPEFGIFFCLVSYFRHPITF